MNLEYFEYDMTDATANGITKMQWKDYFSGNTVKSLENLARDGFILTPPVYSKFKENLIKVRNSFARTNNLDTHVQLEKFLTCKKKRKKTLKI